MRLPSIARPFCAALVLFTTLLAQASTAAPVQRVHALPQPAFSGMRGPWRRAQTSPIQHVIFIVQENRSFNFMFNGYQGALTQNFGYDAQHNKIPLHSQTLDTTWDIDHSIGAYFAACDGTGSLPGTECKMDGWNTEEACCNQPANFAYSYAIRSEVQPYWDMAKQYVLADHMFQSNLDGSFVAHQYEIAAYASQTVNFPRGYWGCPGGFQDTIQTLTQQRQLGQSVVTCFNNPTVGSEADAARLKWRFYTGSPAGNGGIWSAFQAIKPIYSGPDWNADVIPRQSQVLTDIASGSLANITWITPTWANSDHAGMSASGGPAWVASIVNAVGESKFWNSSAIFIMWDDWGGFFDSVKPVFEDYDGLGFRVPLIVISPYAKRRFVAHDQYETASVLRYMEDNFGLPHLAAADTRANDPAVEAFDYTKPPRKFTPIAGARPAWYWLQQEQAARWAPRRELVGGD